LCFLDLIASRKRIHCSLSDISSEKIDSLSTTPLQIDIPEMEIVLDPFGIGEFISHLFYLQYEIIG